MTLFVISIQIFLFIIIFISNIEFKKFIAAVLFSSLTLNINCTVALMTILKTNYQLLLFKSNEFFVTSWIDKLRNSKELLNISFVSELHKLSKHSK